MATTTADAEQDQQHAEALAENARRDATKPVDHDEVLTRWIEAGDEARADENPDLADRYSDAIAFARYHNRPGEAAAEMQRHAAFLLARAAELAGR